MRRFKVKKTGLRKFSLIQTATRAYMKHQADYDTWAEFKEHLACFMEMRLGKTLPNIRIIKKWVRRFCRMDELGMPYPICVVAPMSVLEIWERELELEGERSVVVHGKSFDKRVEITVNEAFGNNGRTWILINYDSLRCTPGLTLLPWFAVILDESTLIKNPKAKISEVCIRGFRDRHGVKHRLILTGLPSPEGELDLFQQFCFLHDNFMGYRNYWEYRNALFELRWDGWKPKTRKDCSECLGVTPNKCNTCEGKGWVPFPVAKMIKDYVHKHAFVLTRKDAGIGSKKVVEPRYVHMTKEQQTVYSRIENEFVAVVGEKGFEQELETDHSIVQRTWLARVAGGCNSDGVYKWSPKVTELISLLKGELANQAVVVGFRFNAEIEAVAYSLKKTGIPFTTLTGADSRDERKRKQEWFRTSGSPSRVILVQIKKVAQYGADMSVSSTMILYSVTYSCEEMSQFLDRIVHPNKEEPLLYLYLLAKNTIDEDVFEVVINGKVTGARQFMRNVKINFFERRERLKH